MKVHLEKNINLKMFSFKQNEMKYFSAYYIKTTYKNNKYKEEIEWYTHGTGGRRMKVMSKVVAWMSLPELYTGE